MSFDDDLRQRMQRAAEAAGRDADPAAAAARVAAATASTGTPTAVVLKIVGGLAVVGVAAGTILGATVLRPDASADAATAGGFATQPGSTFDCPGGAPVGELQPGDRVYVVGRDADDEWSAIRDPNGKLTAVWVHTAALVPDSTATEVPEIECDREELSEVTGTTGVTETTVEDTVVDTTEPTATTPATTEPENATTTTVTAPPTTTSPVTVPPPTTTPTPPPPPPPTAAPTTGPPTTVPPDTEQPSVQAGTGSSSIGGHDACLPKETTLTAYVTDNVGVTAVTASSGPSGTISLQRTAGTAQNGTWTATYGPFPGLPATFDQQVSITVTARDAAGNTRSTNLTMTVQGANCGLI